MSVVEKKRSCGSGFEREDGTRMYKMTVYDADGKMFRVEKANNVEYFERYKHKHNYKIVISKVNPISRKEEIVYSEVE